MSNWFELKESRDIRKIFNTRVEIIKNIRKFFWSQEFIEVETPIAVRFPGQEPYLNPMSVEIKHPDGRDYPFYLRTSPEFALKKLLCAGTDKIFEIGKCFRNKEDFGNLHNPEFTMLEWYRAPGNLAQIMEDVEYLFQFIGRKLDQDFLLRADKKISLTARWKQMSMKDIWKKYLDVDLNKYLDADSLYEFLKKNGFKAEKGDSYESLFYLLFLSEIEPHLGWDTPIIIYNFPAALCSLCSPCKDPLYSQRFEVYIGGMEICNAFGELTDPVKQIENLENERKKRGRFGIDVFAVDTSFIQALQSGMPEAGGIALGVDRMAMLFTGAENINDVIFQSVKDQLEW